ncbi:MAG TPA: class I SAM-dependent methyltransferase [Lacipirellulaceae bacterium]|nr:class I SAM-dependent methyltransferase [Lacipirellulaceae bacterium]
MKTEYSPQYYHRLKSGSHNSAKAVVPVVFQLIKPHSVVDVGCGTGAWLAEFERQGVPDILGVDGAHIPVDQLEIDPGSFLAADFTQPLRLRGQFDLAVSLEVAEHLKPAQSEQFVETLTNLAPVVLFSAAIPYQGGEHHVNEQWPAFWVERFAAHNYIALDPFRRWLWERSDVDWWYAQNLLLFVRQDHVSKFPRLSGLIESDSSVIQTYIHPRNYLNHAWQNLVLRVSVDLATTTRPGDVIVLVDEDRFGALYLPGRIVRPFIERDGIYYGPPQNDAEAIQELDRMQADGASYLAIGWPAFWWLSHYKRFAKHLEDHFFTVLRNEQVVMYRLDVDYEPTHVRTTF